MNIFVFKTDILSKQRVKTLIPIFNKMSDINNWNVDIEDIDNVLRIEIKGKLKENDIMNLVRTRGFNCELLTY